MAKIYLRHILAGNITLEDVPMRWRGKVLELLVESGLEDDSKWHSGKRY